MSQDVRHRDESLLRAAFIVSSSGDWIFRFALPILVLQLTGSAISTALTYAVEFIPFVVIGMFSGVVADRADRRQLMILCDVVSAVIVAGIGVMCLFEPSVVLIMAAAFLLGCVRPFSFPAFQGFLAERVAKERRPAMNAWVQGADATLSTLGPVAGVAVVTLLGPTAASFANGISFAVSAALIAATAVVPTGRRLLTSLAEACRSMKPDSLAGMRLIVSDRGMLWATVLLTAGNFAFPAAAANLIFIMAGPDGEIPVSLAVVTMAQGLGAILGAATAPALMRRVDANGIMWTARAVMGVALLLPAISTEVGVLIACWFLAGASTSAFIVPWRTYRQGAVDPAFLGRVVGLQRAIPFAAIPFSALIGSWLLTEFGATTLFAVIAVIQCLIALATRYTPLSEPTSSTAGRS
ncbi:MFS transporter [Streptomyces sp. NPDC014894]|uniref:MFS transporter n=1 Tax=unclassified Streptomyces TaxID=2593676 RepID=UPI0036FC5E2D